MLAKRWEYRCVLFSSYIISSWVFAFEFNKLTLLLISGKGCCFKNSHCLHQNSYLGGSIWISVKSPWTLFMLSMLCPQIIITIFMLKNSFVKPLFISGRWYMLETQIYNKFTNTEGFEVLFGLACGTWCPIELVFILFIFHSLEIILVFLTRINHNWGTKMTCFQ